MHLCSYAYFSKEIMVFGLLLGIFVSVSLYACRDASTFTICTVLTGLLIVDWLVRLRKQNIQPRLAQKTRMAATSSRRTELKQTSRTCIRGVLYWYLASPRS